MLRGASSWRTRAAAPAPAPARVRRRPCRRLPAAASSDADADNNTAASREGADHPNPNSSSTNNNDNTTSTPHFARIVQAPPSGAPGPAGSQPRAAAVPLPSTPPELQGLRLDEKGDLIDATTGKRLPSLGEPTRFDIKVAALRGDLDPPKWRPNTERAPAALVGALLGPWPLDYQVNAVARLNSEDDQDRQAPPSSPEALADELARLVHEAAACPGPVPTVAGGGVALKVRKGVYASVCVTVRVRSADLLEEAFEALGKDPRVVMRY
jgi:putative lipoic acid-binding regulatory protein